MFIFNFIPLKIFVSFSKLLAIMLKLKLLKWNILSGFLKGTQSEKRKYCSREILTAEIKGGEIISCITGLQLNALKSMLKDASIRTKQNHKISLSSKKM